MSLFEGFADAHGTHGRGVANAAKGGKLEIRTTARTIREPVTVKLWQQHLSGKMPLGIITLRRDSTCMWGAIDVDDYTLSHAEISQRLKREGLPMIVCRTKSGGAHIFVFFSKPIDARVLMDWLRSVSALLGVSGSEVFPKQEKVLWDSDDLGSWLNMPYLDGDKTERYAVNEKGKGMTLRQFLDAAEKLRVDPDNLPATSTVKPTGVKGGGPVDPSFGDGPPCIQTLAGQKVQKGSQNDGLMAFAVLAKKKYPDKWQAVLKEWARLHFDPPIQEDDDGLKAVIKGNTIKAYNYKCKQQPIVSVCNSALCRTRRFGVGGGGAAGNLPKMGNLAVLNTDEPVWFLDVEDARIMLSTQDLLGFAGFQAKTMEATRTVPPMLKKDTWVGLLQSLLETVVVIDAPPEVGVSGQFFEILESLLTDRQQANAKEELLLGKPWHDEATGRVYFRIRDVQEACERVRFRNMSRTKMIAKIKEMGGTHDFMKLRGRGVNVWSVPDGTLSRQEEPHKTPELPEEVI